VKETDQKIVLITGACGQLGSQLAKTYASQGSNVCVTDIDKLSCKELAKELNQISSDKHIFFEMDVASTDSVANMIQFIEENGFQINTLINNAGVGVFSDFFDRTKDEFMKVVEVNLFGTFNCIRQISKHMINNKINGSIVNIGSIYGVVSSNPAIYTDCSRKNSEVYSATKAGVIQMTNYFAVHLADQKIRVNCVSPGGIFNDQGKDFVKNYSERTPQKRMAETDEIVNAVIYLADNNLSSYTTGHNLIIDGGLTSW